MEKRELVLLCSFLAVVALYKCHAMSIDEIIRSAYENGAGVTEKPAAGVSHVGTGNGEPDPRMVVELDIILTPGQWLQIYGPNGRKKRKAYRPESKRWSGGIVYYSMDSSFGTRDKGVIKQALDEWEKLTCVTFQPADGSESYSVRFVNGNGCSSYIGRYRPNQPITLASGCRYKGIIVHEIGHAVGFFHEQSRPDRDSYVTIIKENIREFSLRNFNKYSPSVINTYGVPYDFTSVMHYGKTYFSKNGKPTIVTKDPAFQNVIGNRLGLSLRDVQLANLMYKCHVCSGNEFLCTSNKCIPRSMRCNGVEDCFEGDDEKGCGEDSVLVADSDGGKIVQIGLESGQSRIVHANLARPVAIQFSPEDGRIYWTDVEKDIVGTSFLNGTGFTEFQLGSDLTPDGIAVHVPSDLIYFSDADSGTVNTVNVQDGQIATIISSGLEKPRDVQLDHLNGHIYITDWGAQPGIYRSDMSGQGLAQLVSSNIQSPNGLALNITAGLMYWVDSQTDTIEKSHLDGTARSVVLRKSGAQFYGLVLHGGYFYVSDWNSRAVYKIKEDGSSSTTIGPSTLAKAMGITLIEGSRIGPDACHSSPCRNGATCSSDWSNIEFTCLCLRGYSGDTCQNDINECTENLHNCTKLCENTPGSYRCVCPTGQVLDSDGISCSSGKPVTHGYDPINRSSLDSWSSAIYILTPNQPIVESGKVISWELYARRTGTIYLQVFEKVSGYRYKVIGQTKYVVQKTGAQTVQVASSDQFSVKPGDLLGFYFPDKGIIPFMGKYCASGRVLYKRQPGTVKVGDTFSFRPKQAGWRPCRKYSVRVKLLATPGTTHGDAPVYRRYVDGWRNAMYIINPAKPIPTSGDVTSWQMYARRTGTIYLQVFRKEPGNNNRYKIVGQTRHYVRTTGVQIITVPSSSPISVAKGDLVGFYFPRSGVIPFDGGEGCTSPTLYKRYPSRVDVGAIFTFLKKLPGWKPCRKYSLRLTLACSGTDCSSSRTVTLDR